MGNITMAFDRTVQGWTSEFSFVPDSGLSLNNNYYTFHAGDIWIHNVDETTNNVVRRNTFYTPVTNETRLTFVFNDEPSEVKNFKTLNYEGIGTWSAEVETNVEEGTISATQFVDKEGKYFAFIRGEDNQGSPDLKSGNVGGLGVIGTTVAGSYTMPNLPSTVSIGDYIYLIEPSNGFTGAPVLAGILSTVDGNVIALTSTGLTPALQGVTQLPVSGDLLIYVKNNVVEKSGLIGFYGIVTMTNATTSQTELFSVATEAFIS